VAGKKNVAGGPKLFQNPIEDSLDVIPELPELVV
jgi:hypothetical protein